MNALVVVAVVSIVVLIVVLTELAAATLPLLIVVILVPADERAELAALLAACDSSRRLRLWPALRAAVMARRMRDLPEHVIVKRTGAAWPVNSPHTAAERAVRQQQDPVGLRSPRP